MPGTPSHRLRCAVALACLAVAAGCGPGREARWTEDIDVLGREIAARHVNPFETRSREAFEADLAAVKADLTQLDDDAVFFRLRQAVASLGNAHTNLWWERAADNAYPFQVIPLADGFFVAAARPELADLIGCRLTAVGGVPIDEALKRVATVIPHENEHWVRARFGKELGRARLLRFLELSCCVDRASFAFERPLGDTFTRELAAVPRGDASDGLRDAFDGRGEAVAVSYRNRDRAYWFTCLDEHKALYLQYNRCEETRPMDEFADKLWRVADGRNVERVVIDLRNNSGGSTVILRPIREGLLQRPELNRLGRVWVLIGPHTFSAALDNAVELRSEIRAVFVGRPTGGKPNSSGEVRRFYLPHSETQVSYSSKDFSGMAEPCDALEPDLAVETTSEDYFAGRDPVLEAALTRPVGDLEPFRDKIEARQGDLARRAAARVTSWPQNPIAGGETLAGRWEGSYRMRDTDFGVVFRFEPGADGEVVAFLDLLDEGNVPVPIEEGACEDGRVRLSVGRMGWTFEGALTDGGRAIAGSCRQQGRVVPLTLRRGSGAP